MNEPVPLFIEDQKISHILPVCLPWNQKDSGRPLEDFTDDLATVTGWGRITNDVDNFTEEFKAKRVGSEPLRQVKVPIKSNDFCENVPEFKFNKLKFEKRFCAGGKKGNKEN